MLLIQVNKINWLFNELYSCNNYLIRHLGFHRASWVTSLLHLGVSVLLDFFAAPGTCDAVGRSPGSIPKAHSWNTAPDAAMPGTGEGMKKHFI